MYVSKLLSYYQKYPDALATPPDGPNSGFLVIQDEEAETSYSCFGLCKDIELMDLPFPQNKNLTMKVSSGSANKYSQASYDDIIFIPVLNQPLSSNRYFAIQPHGSHIGEALACSKEEDMGTFCGDRYPKDIKSRPLNPNDIYQQVEIFNFDTNLCSSNGGSRGTFQAKSVALDGFSPSLLARRGWRIFPNRFSTPRNPELNEAHGVNTKLRSRLPEFNNISISSKSSVPVTVGKWYCPFMFVKERTLRDQVKESMFYQMTLEQRWKQIFSSKNEYKRTNVVSLDVNVRTEEMFICGNEARWDERKVVDGAIWFVSYGEMGRCTTSVGLSIEIIERMKWEEERGGWIGGKERKVRVKGEYEFVGGSEEWKKFGCYVLVERFVLKRMDGSLVMTYDFKHTHQIRTKWE